ncbi:MAG: hypothetical protein QXQ33_03775 [Nitrososphaerota archaeon]
MSCLSSKKRSRYGISPLISEVILLSGVIALGLAIWGLSISYFGVTSVQNAQEFDKMISSQRALLIIEAVDPASGKVWVSNHGLVNVVVISCTIYPKSTGTSGYRPNVPGLVVVPKDPSVLVSLTCEKIGSPPYIGEVWYLPAHLYDVDNPVRNIQWAGVVRYDTTEPQ